MALDAEGVAQGEGDLAAGGAGGVDRRFHRRARHVGVPQIAFEVEDRGLGDSRRVDRARLEQLRRAEEGVHRPLRIGRDQDEAAGGGADVAARGDEELDALRFDIVLEDVAELVVGDLADEAGLQPERGEAGGGVAGRARR